jgi:pimeloyl-ACP methyl ester carboxylesterase
MLSSKNSDKHRLICEAATAAGCAALRFDFRGRGESDGDPSILTVSNEIEDLTAAISSVRALGYPRVVVVGSSLGGTVAILTGSRESDLIALVTIAAPARLADGPREAWGGSGRETADHRIEVAPGEFIDAGFFTDAARHDVVGAARSLSVPWLIIHGDADPVVPVGDATLLAEAARNGEFVVHPSAGHRFDQPEEREWLIETVAGFLGRVGEPDAPIAKGRGSHL